MQRSGIFGILLGVFFIVGALVGGALIGWRAYQKTPNEITLLGPGQATLQASQAGSYMLWNDYQTVFQGTTHRDSPQLPSDWHFTMTQDATGQKVALPPQQNITRRINTDLSVGISMVDIDQPGNYTLVVTGTSPQRVFSIGYSPFNMMGDIFRAAAPVSMVGMLLGIPTLIWGIVKAVKQDRENLERRKEG